MAEHFTEGTLFKVYKALRATGLTEEQAERVINELQSQGILFRERGDRPLQQRPGKRSMTGTYRARRDDDDEDEG